MEADLFKRRTAPGHPVKYLFHRSTFDLGPHYRNVGDWAFDKSKPFYRKNLLAHFGCVNAIEFSKDGSMLVSGGDDRRILLWKIDKAMISKVEPKIMQAEHLSNVFSLDFSCTSEKIISAGNDDQVILHDLNTGVPLDYFVHEQPVYGVSADPVNENIFCSACDDGRILIYDIRESGNDPFCLAKVTSAFHSVMFHPVEPRLVVTSNSKEGVASWDVRMPKRILVKYGLQNSNQCCMSARFNRMGTQILVLRRRLPPILYSTDSPSHLYQFNHRGYYNSCTMKSCSFAGQNDQYVLSGSDNFDLHAWKIPMPGSDQWVNRADMILRGHRSIVNQVRYNYTHNVIASSGVEKIVKLWCPFPMPDERGGKSPVGITQESKRRIYTPDDYVSLVMQSGQGHFMSLTFEGGRKTTREDSRMLAFFDALVQRDINGVSDEDSDNFYEGSYTNTVYTSPETSSSDNDDDDSNPPNMRLALPSDTDSFRHSIETSRTPRDSEEASVARPNSDQATDEPTISASEAEPREEAVGESNEEVTTHADTLINTTCDIEPIQPTEGEDRDATANMITQLILEKEDNRRKYSRPNKEDSESESESDNNTPHCSTSRPLKPHKKRGKLSKKSSKSSGSNYSKFRKHIFDIRRREQRLETPVYDSSRNSAESTPQRTSETNYNRISELMTRNQSNYESDSSSSSSSSSDSSSSGKDCESKNSPVMPEKKKRYKRAIISSDSSSCSDTGVTKPMSDEVSKSSESNEPSSSHNSRSFTSKESKRKRKPPCKLKEACKAYFKDLMKSQREPDDSGIPHKRANIVPENNDSDTNHSSNLVEQVIFKRLGKHKGRNYRNGSSNVSGTPPDSGIDVSREPEPCCSKSIKVSQSSSSKAVSSRKKSDDEKKDKDKGYVDSSDSSEDK